MPCLISGSVRHDVVCVNALFSCKFCFLSGFVSHQTLIDLTYFQFSAVNLPSMFCSFCRMTQPITKEGGGGGGVLVCERVGNAGSSSISLRSVNKVSFRVAGEEIENVLFTLVV